MTRRARRAFTLIEILVVLAIITMVLALAAPAVMGMLKTTSIVAAADVLRAAVSSTRSSAVSSRKSCSIDIRNVIRPDNRVITESVSTSAILTAEDFEPYIEGRAENDPNFDASDEGEWGFYPPANAWELHSQQTRELWVGRREDNSSDPYVGNAYAWNVGAKTPRGASTDLEITVLARFRARQVLDARDEWGFGVLSNFTRTSRKASGYRFAVRAEANNAGWNTVSKAQIEKIFCPSNPANENAYVATDADTNDDKLTLRELDEPAIEKSCALTPGVWYWMKMRMNRAQQVVTLAGKIWVDGSPEPAAWTVGPVYDRWDESDAPAEMFDNFGPGGNPLDEGFCGVWSTNAETAIDDFSVDWRNTWPLPKGIFMQPKQFVGVGGTGADEFGLAPLDRYEPGSFPVTYRADGTAASDRAVLLVITNISSGDRRAVMIDRNTGRVEAADDLTVLE